MQTALHHKELERRRQALCKLQRANALQAEAMREFNESERCLTRKTQLVKTISVAEAKRMAVAAAKQDLDKLAAALAIAEDSLEEERGRTVQLEDMLEQQLDKNKKLQEQLKSEQGKNRERQLRHKAAMQLTEAKNKALDAAIANYERMLKGEPAPTSTTQQEQAEEPDEPCEFVPGAEYRIGQPLYYIETQPVVVNKAVSGPAAGSVSAPTTGKKVVIRVIVDRICKGKDGEIYYRVRSVLDSSKVFTVYASAAAKLYESYNDAFAKVPADYKFKLDFIQLKPDDVFYSVGMTGDIEKMVALRVQDCKNKMNRIIWARREQHEEGVGEAQIGGDEVHVYRREQDAKLYAKFV